MVSRSIYLAFLCFVAVILAGNSRKLSKGKLGIFNGTYAEPSEAQFMVALVFLKYDGGTGFCGGSLLNHNTVLTAAHCLTNVSQIELHYGSHQRTSGERIYLRRGSMIIHPKYQPGTEINDLAILKLPMKIKANSQKVQFIQLSNRTNIYQEPAFKNARAYGWGMTRPDRKILPIDLMKIDMDIRSKKECDAGVGDDSEKMICTRNPTAAICEGDSGSVLIRDGVLIGVTSYVDEKTHCTAGSGAYFTNVAHYADWIQKYACGKNCPK